MSRTGREFERCVALLLVFGAGEAQATQAAQAPILEHGAAFTSQLAPRGRDASYRGELRCGPSCGVMEYSRHGLKMDWSDAQRILHIDSHGNRSGNVGMPPSRLEAALAHDGLPVTLLPNPTLDALREALSKGSHALLLGRMTALPLHRHLPTQHGHWILVPAMHGVDGFVVHDPLEPTEAPMPLDQAVLHEYLTSLRDRYRLDRYHDEPLTGTALLVSPPGARKP